jgi:phenylacetate-CoA ligase
VKDKRVYLGHIRDAIVRRIVLPAHEALLQRPTMSILRSLEEGAAGSESDAGAYQSGRIASLLEHARLRVPFWQELSQRNGRDLPVLTRAAVRAHLDSMRWQGAPGKLIRHRSSGTTDDNLDFYLDRQRQGWHRALRMRALARLGIEVGEKQLHFWPHFGLGGASGAMKDAARVVRDRLTNDAVFDLRPMGDARLDEALAWLEAYKPALVVGYPSWLHALARRRLSAGGRPPRARPRLVLSTGELLYEFQRASIESAFGARVVEEYGSQDVGLIASEDATGRWRVNWEHVAIELLRDGGPAAPGEMGEIVVTNLHSQVMPFIRYATGDVVTVPADPPLTEQAALTTLPRIEGRASDVLIGADGRPRSNRGLIDTLVRETGRSEFSLHQTAPERIVCMTIRDGGCCGQEEKVADLLRSLLGGALRVEWRIGSAFRPLRSGKRRYACSPVAHALLAHDRESGMPLARTWPQRVLDEA